MASVLKAIWVELFILFMVFYYLLDLTKKENSYFDLKNSLFFCGMDGTVHIQITAITISMQIYMFYSDMQLFIFIII